jgi:hypothetical protein
MAQPFEDFLVALAEKGDPDVLNRIDGYLHSHLVQVGNALAERDRLVVAFRDKAPDTELSAEILNRVSVRGRGRTPDRESQVRRRLAAGGTWIRTLGPP